MRTEFDLASAVRARRLSAALLATTSCFAMALAMTTPAGAADLNWDANGAAAGLGGTGTWNATGSNWSTTTDGVSGHGVWPNSISDKAIFGGTTGTVTLGAPITANGLSFLTSGYTIGGGTLTLGGASPTISYSGGNTATINSVLAGGAGLTVNGGSTNGWLQLGGANTFTGGVTVNSNARLIATGANSLNGGANVVTVNSGGVLQIQNSNAFGGNTSAAGLVLNDGANLWFANQNLTHDITANGGTVVIADVLANGNSTWTGKLNLTAATRLLVSNTGAGDNLFFTGNLTDTGANKLSLELNEGGAVNSNLQLTGTNSFTGGITLNAGHLYLGGNDSAAAGAGNVVTVNSGILSVSSANAFGGDTDAAQLVLNSSGVLRVETGNTAFNHDVTLTGGTAFIDGLNSTWNGAAVLTADTLLQLGVGGFALTVGGPLSDNGGVLSLHTTADVRFNGALSFSGDLNLGSGNTWFNGGAYTYTGDTVLESNARLLLNSTSLSPNSNIRFEGLNNNGHATVIYGTAAKPSITMPNGAGGGQLRWNGTGGFYALAGQADVTVNLGGAGATLTWNDGNFVPTGHALILGTNTTDGNARQLDFQNGIDLTGGLRQVRADNGYLVKHAVISGVLSGTGGLQVLGNGGLELTNSNTYSGPTVIGDAATNGHGALILGSADALPATSNLQLNGFTNTNTVSDAGMTLLTAASGDFTKSLGVGPGQVQWTASGGFGAIGGPRTVNLGGAGATLTWGAGGFVPTGAALRFGGRLSNSTVNWQNGIDLGATNRTINVNEGVGGGFALATDLDVNLNGVIGGSGGGLVLTGSGDVALNALNTYTGPTYIGGVNVGGVNDQMVVWANTLADTGAASSLGAGGTVVLNSHGGGLVYTGAATTTNRTLALNETNGGIQVLFNRGSGALSWTGNVTTTGAGLNTLRLGGTFVSSDLDGDGVADDPNVISGVISNGSGITQIQGSGGNCAAGNVWRLAGANTFTGDVNPLGCIFETTTIGAAGAAGGVGAGNLVADYRSGDGTLRYIGAGESSNRLFWAWGDSHLESSGTGPLKLTNTGLVVSQNGGYTHWLGGGNTGDNTLAATLVDSPTPVDFTTSWFRLGKEGPGLWALAGDSNAQTNAYSHNTLINGGALRIDNAGAITGGLGVASSHGAAGSSQRSSMILFGGAAGGAGGVLGLTAASGGFSRGLTTANQSFANNNGTALTTDPDGAGPLPVLGVAALDDDNYVQGVRWIGSGGFAAWGGVQTVNLFGDAREATWGAGGFVPTAHELVFGYATADGTVDFRNGINLGTAARTVRVANGTADRDAVMSGVLRSTSAAGGLTKTGAGKLALTAANTYTGLTTISDGALILGQGGTTGSLASPAVSNYGMMGFDRSDTLTYGGVISQTGSVEQIGAGKTQLTGTNTYTGGTTIRAGTLELGAGGATGSIVGAVTDNGVLSFNRNNLYAFSGLVSGSGELRQTGSGITTLSAANSYLGPTNVMAGTLRINGDQSAATGLTTVFSGGALGGSGVIGGDVLVQNGGAISPGNSPGTLTINGDLALNASSVLNMEFGQANVPGGPLNDLIKVNGDLTLDGTINVTEPSGGIFSAGVYRVIDYTGALTDHTLDVGALPAGSTASVQTSVAGQVNLVNTAGQSLYFWDGPAGAKNDGTVTGGTGGWRLGGGGNDWTNASGSANSDFPQNAFAVFQGTPGVVSVDGGGGSVGVSGIQFAVDGYSVAGAGLTLSAAETPIRVGDGTPASSGMTATINSALSGSAQLVKVDQGTLVLGGTNTYSGGTLINGGVLQVSNDANLGSSAGRLTFDGGTLRLAAGVASARNVTLNAGGGTIRTDGVSTLSGVIGGDGALAKTGTSLLTLTGANTYTGGTTISAGELALGNGAATGSILGDVLNNAQLTFGNPGAQTFTGAISGSGQVRMAGPGTEVLTGTNTYAGPTTVAAGTLLINGDQTGATGLTSVSGGTLGGTGTIGGDVTIATAALAPGGTTNAPGALTIKGDLTLGAASKLNFDFGQANVPGGPLNDLLKVEGNVTLAGATIDVAQSGGGDLGPGLYRVMDYAGTRTGTLTMGTAPASASFSVQTSVDKQVNLINTAGLTANMWDGDAGVRNDGLVSGGAGTWQGTTGNDNWTPADGSANAGFTDAAFAIFAKTGGLVTVDAASHGAVNVSGMQFAVDGYTVAGDAVNLTGAATVRVGDGTADSAGMTATIGSALTGTGGLIKSDLGTLTLSGANSYAGATRVDGGMLQIDGDQTAAVGLTTVNGGGTLAGGGTIGGGVRVNAGGVLSPGDAGVGNLTIKGGLALAPDATLNMELGQAGTPGGALNDLITVGGDLTLDGTLNVTESVGGAFGPGVYRLIDYGGSLTDHGLDVGTLPAGAGSIQTSIARQVNLVTPAVPSGGGGGPGPGPGGPGPGDPGPGGPGPGDPGEPGQPPLGSFNFWDGGGASADGRVSGGAGSWRAGGGEDWTDLNGAANGGYADGAFAIFAGTGATVDVDLSAGPVTASGMQFAADGYRIEGDAVTLTGSEAIVRVGDGTTAGANFTATVASELTGAARLVKTDGGALVLTGANSYAGGTTVSGGTLVGAAGSFGSGGILNNAALVFDQPTDAAFGSAIDGAGSLTKRGAGRLTYTGTGALSGATTVEAGVLAVNGSLAGSPVTVRSGAGLGGSGQVGAAAIQSGGFVAPGDGVGTLSVNGAFSQASGSTYQVQIDPGAKIADRLDATGAAFLADGAVLSVARAGSGVYTPGTTYTVLHADGGVTGTYKLTGDVGSLSAFLGLKDSYDARNVYLTVDQVRPFRAVAWTWNQTVTAEAADGLPADNVIRTTLLNLPDEASARTAFDQLSGEAAASAKSVLIAHSELVRDAAFARLRACDAGTEAPRRLDCADTDGVAGWAQALGGWGDIDGDGNAASVDHSAAGFLIGFDAPLGEWRLGGFAGYSRSDWSVDDRHSSGDSDDYHVGVYGGRSWNRLGLRLGAAHAWHDISSGRAVAFGGFSDGLHADYRARTAQAFADLSYRVDAAGAAWDPFVRLAYVRLHANGFTEAGGAAALTARADTQDTAISTVGVRPSTTVELGSVRASLRGMLGWRHAFADVLPTATAALAGSRPFTPLGAPLARDAAAAEAGLDFDLGDRGIASVTYGGQFSDRASDQRLRVDVRFRF